MVWRRSLLFGGFSALAVASPLLEARQAATTGTTAATGPTTAPLVETTINGKVTTVPVAVPTGAGTITITGTAASQAGTSTTETAALPTSTIGACTNDINMPICEPQVSQTLYVGNTYYVSWNPSVFPTNSSISIGLQSINDTQPTVAWMSSLIPANKGFTTVTIDKSWMGDYTAINLTLIWDFFSTDVAGQKHEAFNIGVMNAPSVHYPAPPHTKLPNKESLIIALPIVFGFLALVIVGLLIGMKKHRTIGLKSIMGRKKGYGAGKSRAQRMGIKKGAIRLEDREVLQSRGVRQSEERGDYHDDVDAITPAHGHGQAGYLGQRTYDKEAVASHAPHLSDFSLGSLVDEEDEPNAFRKEIKQQRTGQDRF